MMRRQSSTSLRILTTLGLGLALAGCGRETSSSDFRLAGAGLDPQEIGPQPSKHGGLIEYNWVNFAGAGLPLALLGLVSYTAAGPELSRFKPPYAAITGFAYIFEGDEPAPDTLFGSWSPPPAVEGACYTNYDPRSFISSLVDVGTEVKFRAAESDTYFRIGRRPALYGPNAEAAFPIYFAFETWRNEAMYYKVFPEGSESLGEYEDKLAFGRNFPHGERVEVSFPGALPPEEASFGAIPVPLAAAGAERVMRLPTRSDSVVLQWKGPVYDSRGDIAQDGGDQRTTCLSYFAPGTTPSTPSDCIVQPELENSVPEGQLYTAPWDAEDGKLTLYYEAAPLADGEATDEFITVSVRFLGPLDTDDEYKHEYVVEVPANESITESWETYDGISYPEGEPVPAGRRPAGACEGDDDGAGWKYDDDLVNADGSPITTLKGEPSHRLAEVTCRLPTPAQGALGSFDLTMDMLDKAYAYAQEHGAEGAIFYVSRGTSMNLETPPVRDAYGNRRDTSTVKVVSYAVSLGRFHYGAK